MFKFKKQKGFTLIELLVVIALIGVVATIAFVSLNSAREKTRRSSNLATMASAMPEVVVCADENGFGYTDGVPLAGLTYICQNSSTGNNQKGEHSILWPALTAGWVYNVPTGSLSSVDYVYTATKPGSSQPMIVCSYSSASCI